MRMLKTKSEFDSFLSEAGSKPVVIDFTASWCGPCRMIAPKFEELANEKKDVACFAKVDVDENEETAASNDVSAMPTFGFFKSGKCVDKVVGASIEKVQQALEKLLA